MALMEGYSYDRIPKEGGGVPEMTEETPRAAPAGAPALARRVAAPATPSPPAAKSVPTAAPAPS